MELDNMLTDLVSITNRTKPGQVTHKIADIKEYVNKEIELQRHAAIAEKEKEFWNKLGNIQDLGHEQCPLWDEICELSAQYSPSEENR